MRKSLKLQAVLLLLCGVLVLAGLAAGCGGGETATTESSPTTESGANAEPGDSTDADEGAPTETIKIGVIYWSGWTLGVDDLKQLEVCAAMTNDAGGLDVGGTKYKIELISYNSDNNEETAVAAMNRLIFEDKVKFIYSDIALATPLIPIAEANDVLYLTDVNAYVQDPFTENRHTFAAVGFDSYGVMATLFKEMFPEAKTVLNVAPDHARGHMNADSSKITYTSAGFEFASEFYPPDQADLSAIATKVAHIDPDLCSVAASGVPVDPTLIQAIWDAGYRGEFVCVLSTSASMLAQYVSPEVLPHLHYTASATEYDPPASEIAKAFREKWEEIQGTWTGPEMIAAGAYFCLVTALEKAGTLDVDTVAEVIGSGLEFESPMGKSKMINRAGLEWTNSALVGMSIKAIAEDGTPSVAATLSLEDGLEFVKDNPYTESLAP